MRRDRLYLEDIIEAADAIAGFIAGLTEQSFQRSDLVRSAVAQKLMIIGEAASRLSSDLKKRHPEVPWAEIMALRNILVHAYFGIQWDLVWRAASEEVPLLRRQLAKIVQAEFGGPS